MKQIVIVLLIFTYPSLVLAQETTFEFLPQDNRNGFELVEYSMLPDGRTNSEEDAIHQIKFRFFAKSLSGEWLTEKESNHTDEDLFLNLVLSTYRNLTSLTELELVLDQISFSERQEQYAIDESTALYEDIIKYDSWIDVRPFALIRYASLWLIVCDVKTAGQQEDSTDSTVVIIPTIRVDGEYRLTEIIRSSYGVDLVVGNFLNGDSYDGEIWTALRSRAGEIE